MTPKPLEPGTKIVVSQYLRGDVPAIKIKGTIEASLTIAFRLHMGEPVAVFDGDAMIDKMFDMEDPLGWGAICTKPS